MIRKLFRKAIRRLFPAPTKPAPKPPPRIPQNCTTCYWSRYVGTLIRSQGFEPFGAGFTCDALTMDEDEDRPILDYISAHCGDDDGMPVDTEPCPAWRPAHARAPRA